MCSLGGSAPASCRNMLFLPLAVAPMTAIVFPCHHDTSLLIRCGTTSAHILNPSRINMPAISFRLSKSNFSFIDESFFEDISPNLSVKQSTIRALPGRRRALDLLSYSSSQMRRNTSHLISLPEPPENKRSPTRLPGDPA